MELRRATPTDAPAIAAYWGRGRPDATGPTTPSWYEPIHRRLAGGDLDLLNQVVVADLDGVAAGHMWLGPGELHQLCVSPEHEDRGLAARLLTAAERQWRQAGLWRGVALVPAGDGATVELLRAGWLRLASGPLERFEIDLDGDREPSDHVRLNREAWNEWAPSYAGAGHRAYAPERRLDPRWGVFGVPESQVGLLRDVADQAVVELGCGTGYVSAWCLAAGARSVVGLDNSPGQLATARALQQEHRVTFPLLLADAERAPLASDSFDVAISEYGAAIWCDPYRWIPEAARLLRPGGRLIFLGNSVQVVLCVPSFESDGPAAQGLRRPQRGLHRLEFPDTTATEFHLSHGDMIRLLRTAGFEVLDLIELYAPPEATSTHDFVDATWASQWPVEEVWVARLAR